MFRDEISTDNNRRILARAIGSTALAVVLLLSTAVPGAALAASPTVASDSPAPTPSDGTVESPYDENRSATDYIEWWSLESLDHSLANGNNTATDDVPLEDWVDNLLKDVLRDITDDVDQSKSNDGTAKESTPDDTVATPDLNESEFTGDETQTTDNAFDETRANDSMANETSSVETTNETATDESEDTVIESTETTEEPTNNNTTEEPTNNNTTDETTSDESLNDTTDETPTDHTPTENTVDDETTNDTTEATATENASSVLNTTRVEHHVHRYVNEERTKRGLATLEFDADLQAIARGHSEDMADRTYFSHTDPEGNNYEDRYRAYGYECRAYIDSDSYYTGGENIAYTYFETDVLTDAGDVIHHDTERELARGIVDQWMNSEGHRQNLLADYWENEGIGIAVTDENKVYATQNFC